VNVFVCFGLVFVCPSCLLCRMYVVVCFCLFFVSFCRFFVLSVGMFDRVRFRYWVHVRSSRPCVISLDFVSVYCCERVGIPMCTQ